MNKPLRLQARELRASGQSLNEISRTIGVAKSTISNWVRDIELTNVQYEELSQNQRRYAAQNKGAQVNRDKARELRKAWQEVGRQHARNATPLFLADCISSVISKVQTPSRKLSNTGCNSSIYSQPGSAKRISKSVANSVITIWSTACAP